MRPMIRSLFSCLVIAVVYSCASTPPVKKTGEIPRGSEIVVISFRDCDVAGQEEDCNGSGRKAAEVFREAFSEGGKFTSRLVDRPVPATQKMSDDDAADFARKKGYAYVINGVVDDFYSVAAMTFRADKAAVTVSVIRASDAQVMAYYSRRATAGSNFATPEGMIKGIAKFVRDSL